MSPNSETKSCMEENNLLMMQFNIFKNPFSVSRKIIAYFHHLVCKQMPSFPHPLGNFHLKAKEK